MTIGTFGDDIVFEVSDGKILTIDKFSRTSKANYAEHKVVNDVAILEFLGRELEVIKFKVLLSRELGISDLLMEAHKFRQKCWDGTAEFFSLNGHLYTEHKMVITDVGEDVPYFDGRGRHIVTELDLTLKEYREHLQNDN